nr:hypothetical protein HmN_000803100 [Hymenolepis microstoma]
MFGLRILLPSNQILTQQTKMFVSGALETDNDRRVGTTKASLNLSFYFRILPDQYKPLEFATDINKCSPMIVDLLILGLLVGGCTNAIS